MIIDGNFNLTLHTTGDNASALRSSGASTVENKGSLTLTGKGLDIENTSSDDTHYGLDNSGSFTVASDPVTSSMPSVAFHCANTAIHNAGTLGNAWMEWRFADAPAQSGAEIAFTATEGADPSITTIMHYNKTFAAIVTPGNTYRLWAVASADARIQQKGFDSEGTAIMRFPATAADNAVAVFTGVGDLKTVQISGNQAFSTVGCAHEDVLVKSDGVLTVDADNAAAQAWKDFPGTTTDGTKAADLAADSPYLLAAEVADTKVAFTATAPAGSPIEIPATATVSLGDALANGVFLFQANPNLANLTLRNIYVLNAEGTRFDLRESDYVLKPFEAYITANAFTRSRLRSVGVADDSVVTANEIAAATAALRVWATDGALHVYSGEAAALTVVRSDGRVVYAASIAPGDTRLALPSGIYMIRINNITYKIAL